MKPKSGWRVIAGSVAGTRHVAQGRNCEDATSFFVENGLLALVVSDGAGSAIRGRDGAALAVQAALFTIQQGYRDAANFGPEQAKHLVCAAFYSALDRLQEEASRLSVAVAEFCCTLIVIISDGRFLLAGQVGDGAVVVRDNAQELVLISTPVNGEFANETPLLGSKSFVDVIVSSASEVAIRDVAVCTDGIQRLAFILPSCAPHAAFFNPLFEGLAVLNNNSAEQALRAFLSSARISAKTDDDKTLVVAQFFGQ